MVQVFIPRESESGETRVAASPETVKGLIKAGAKIRIETGAGDRSGFPDADFVEVGAEIGTDAPGAWSSADLVLAIRPPSPTQCGTMKAGALLVCGMQPHLFLDAVKALRDAKVTCFAMDLVPRITRAQRMDILSSQATCAGYQAVLMAASRLPSFFPQLMTAAGTIRPARVLVLGAGVAGLQAIASARKLGAVVEANDIRPVVKEQVESLGARFVDTGTPPDAETSGGYAKEAGEDFLRKQREILTEHMRHADVVITTALIPGKKAPILMTKDMVEAMHAGSVIVDLAAPMGGNVEGTVPGEDAEVDGVTILGHTNLPALVGRDASLMFSRNILSFLDLVLREQKLEPDWEDEILQACVVTRDGEITNEMAKTALTEGGAA